MARVLGAQLRVAALIAVLLGPVACGQTAPTSPQTSLDVLQQMSAQAAVIFTGQVLAVRRPGTKYPETVGGVVEVDFRVDRPVLGCSAGTYTLREWGGLWVVDHQRYRVGERLLVLLYAPSAAGLSSPVGGLDGAIPIRQGGTASLTANTPPPPPYVDLRWLGAKLPRTVSYRSLPVSAARQASSAAARSTQGPVATSASAGPASVGAGTSSVPAEQASVEAVIGMLSTWQKAQHAAR